LQAGWEKEKNRETASKRAFHLDPHCQPTLLLIAFIACSRVSLRCFLQRSLGLRVLRAMDGTSRTESALAAASAAVETASTCEGSIERGRTRKCSREEEGGRPREARRKGRREKHG
jgi:hypothetical protein